MLPGAIEAWPGHLRMLDAVKVEVARPRGNIVALTEKMRGSEMRKQRCCSYPSSVAVGCRYKVLSVIN